MSKTTKKIGNGNGNRLNNLDAILKELNHLQKEIKELKLKPKKEQKQKTSEFKEIARIKTSNNNPSKIGAIAISIIKNKVAISHLWKDEQGAYHPKGKSDIVVMLSKGATKTLIHELEQAHDKIKEWFND